MQTFLPWDDFDDSANALDYRRLGKQRVETQQILNVLVSINPNLAPPNELSSQRPGWRNHPAVLMWEGYDHALALYGIAICEEWLSRGYRDGVCSRFWQHLQLNYPVEEDAEMPWWFGREEFHDSHRAMLKMKDPEFYSDFPNSRATGYWWPTEHMDERMV